MPDFGFDDFIKSWRFFSEYRKMLYQYAGKFEPHLV